MPSSWSIYGKIQLMTQDEFTKLYNYMQAEFKKVNGRFDEVATSFNEVYSRIDGLTKIIADYNQEMLMLAHKVDRLEK